VFFDPHRHLASGATGQSPLYGELGTALAVILCVVVGMVVLITLLAFLEPPKTGIAAPAHQPSKLRSP
jgi:hypothetical protein